MPSPHRSLPVAVAAALLLVLGALAPSLVAGQGTPVAMPGAAPSDATYEASDCPFTVPRAFSEGDSLTCGFVDVPLFHDDPDGERISLFTVLLSSTGDDPRDEPLVFLAGGPGQGASSQLSGFLPGSDLYGDLLDAQDILLVDQRGTGYSEPALFCPTDGGPTIPLLDEGGDGPATTATPAPVDPDLDTTGAESVEALGECRDALVDDGIVLEAFTSAESAADINDIRSAMGFHQVDIYGVSYGSRLGLVLLREYPEIVRAAVLASVLPPQVNQFGDQVIAFDDALDQAFALCADDPDCAETYGDLSALFDETVEQLNEEPIEVDLVDITTGQPRGTELLDGSIFTFVVYETLFVSPLLPLLPELITAANAGDGAPFGLVLSVLSTALTSGFASGMLYTVNCIEEVPFAPVDETEALLDDEDIRPALVEDETFNTVGEFADACAVWDVAAGDEIENEPVTSDVPTLLMSGQFDPITPPSHGELAAETLPNSFVVELPAVGHDPVASAGGCGFEIMLAFLGDPETEPDTACTDDLEVEFRT
jgi:pimeloyl-ACP methyl ester carboxylesterase